MAIRRKRVLSVGDQPKAKLSCRRPDKSKSLPSEHPVHDVIDSLFDSVFDIVLSQSGHSSDNEANSTISVCSVACQTDAVAPSDAAAVAAAVAAASMPTTGVSSTILLQAQIAGLTVALKDEQELVDKLSTRLAFVMSFLGIEVDGHPVLGDPASQMSNRQNNHFITMENSATKVVHSSSDGVDESMEHEETVPTVLPGAPANTTSANAAAAAAPPGGGATSVQSTSLVVSGLPPHAQASDKTIIRNMFAAELKLNLDVVKCKRLGRPVSGMIQPLHVVLRSKSQVDNILRRAKELRKSQHAVIRDCVFVNRYMTAEQSRVAYVKRQRRRQQCHVQIPVGASSTPPPSSVAQTGPQTLQHLPQSLGAHVQQPQTYQSSLYTGAQQQMMSSYLHQGQLLQQSQQSHGSGLAVYGQDAVAPGSAAAGFLPFNGTQSLYNVPPQPDGQGSGSCIFGYS